MVPTYRVSALAAYHRWKSQEGDDIGWLYNAIFADQSTEAMSRGTAFHKALETALEGEYSTVEANGYTFAFTCEAELYLPKTREQRRSKDYGGIIVSGQCDGISSRYILDHKTTANWNGGSGDDLKGAEKYIDGPQWRFYLDIFEADRFDWHIWEVGEVRDAPRTYEVYNHHLLTQYRYPGLEEDCRSLALEFRDFANRMGWQGKAA